MCFCVCGDQEISDRWLEVVYSQQQICSIAELGILIGTSGDELFIRHELSAREQTFGTLFPLIRQK